MSLRERFEARVSPEPNTGCWLWLGRVNPAGYGVIDLPGHDGPPALAHRVSFEIYRGPLTECALHRCDQPCCVNPRHLFEGTQLDNIADMLAKGRHRCGPGTPGEANPFALLTAADVREIRRLSEAGVSQHEIARRLGAVSRGAVSNVLLRKTWGHVQ